MRIYVLEDDPERIVALCRYFDAAKLLGDAFNEVRGPKDQLRLLEEVCEEVVQLLARMRVPGRKFLALAPYPRKTFKFNRVKVRKEVKRAL